MSATQQNALLSRNHFFNSLYTSVDNELFEWLMSTFLPYFTNWKNSIESRRGGPYSNEDKARLFISWQTHDHTFINQYFPIYHPPENFRVRAIRVRVNPNSPNPNPNHNCSGGVINRKVPIN